MTPTFWALVALCYLLTRVLHTLRVMTAHQLVTQSHLRQLKEAYFPLLSVTATSLQELVEANPRIDTETKERIRQDPHDLSMWEDHAPYHWLDRREGNDVAFNAAEGHQQAVERLRKQLGTTGLVFPIRSRETAPG